MLLSPIFTIWVIIDPFRTSSHNSYLTVINSHLRILVHTEIHTVYGLKISLDVCN